MRKGIKKLAQSPSNTFAKDTLILSTATIVSRITGLMRVMALGLVLALGHVANSYYLANTIPNMIYELILGGILTSIIIPIFVEYLAKHGEDEAWRVASLVANGAFILLGTVFLAGTFLPYYFVRIQTLTVDPKEIQLATFFFRFFAVQILFYGLAAIATAMLNSHRRFTTPAIAPIFNNIIVVCTVLFLYLPFSKTNPNLALASLAIGTTAGVFSMLAVQLPALFSLGIRYKLTFNFKHPAIIKLLKLSLPLFIYVATNQFQLTVENNLAFPRIETGGVSAVVIAWQFFQLPFGVLAVSIITALFPSLSENAALKDMKSFKKDLSLGIRSTSLVIIPSAVLLALLSRPILSLVMGYKKMTAADISLVGTVLLWFAIGLLSYALFMFLLKVFYSLQDTVTPTVVNLFGVGLLVIVDLLLIEKIGVAAIAVGRTVFFTFMLIALAVLIRKKIGAFSMKRITISTSKSLLAGTFMALAVFFTLKTTGTAQTLLAKAISVFGPAAAGLFIFVLVSLLIKNEELSTAFKLVGQKFANKF